jgi:hypothetical protein
VKTEALLAAIDATYSSGLAAPTTRAWARYDKNYRLACCGLTAAYIAVEPIQPIGGDYSWTIRAAAAVHFAMTSDHIDGFLSGFDGDLLCARTPDFVEGYNTGVLVRHKWLSADTARKDG